MACEQEQNDLEVAIASVTSVANSKAKELSDRAENETRNVGDSLEQDDEIAATIGAAAGGAVGGVIGGAPGAAAGAVIGREIGKLFIIDIEMRRAGFSMDVPVFYAERQDMSFDVPSVTMRNRDVIFHLPAIRMKRVKTGEKPETTCSGGGGWPPQLPSCTVTWTPIYIDVPEPYMQENRIVIGMPDIGMNRMDVVIDTPAVRMERQDFSIDIPAITIRTKFEESRRVKDQADTLSQKYGDQAAVLAAHVKELSKEQIIPKMSGVFNCHRKGIQERMNTLPQQFDPAIASTTSALAQLRANSVPADDDDYIRVSETLADLIKKRQDLVDQLQKALDDLAIAEKTAVDKIMSS